MPKKLLVLLLLFLAITAVGATIYKWVDEKGVTYYSATPPPNQKAQKVQTAPPPPAAVDGGRPALKTLQEEEQEFQKRRAERQQESNRIEESSAEQAEGERRCLETRKQLAMLQEQLPVYRDEEGKFRVKWKYDAYQGERKYLDDATRTSEIARARQEIEAICPRPSDAKDQDLARKQMTKETTWSDHCAVERAHLEAIERPEARTPKQEIAEQRQNVERWCKE